RVIWRNWLRTSRVATRSLGTKRLKRTSPPVASTRKRSRRLMPKSMWAISLRFRDLARAAVFLEIIRQAAATRSEAGSQAIRSIQEKSAAYIFRLPEEGQCLHCRDRSQLPCHCPRTRRRLLLVLDRHTRRLQQV